MKLKLYSNQECLPRNTPHSTIFHPFWGRNPSDFEKVDEGRRFDQYCEVGQSFFEMVPLADADVVILPADWTTDESNQAQLMQFAASAASAKKHVVAFFWSDLFDDIPLENSIVLRTSLNRSARKPFEFSIPVWSEDFINEYLHGAVPIHTKSAKPSVGFCGFALPLQKTLRHHSIDLLRHIKAIAQGRTGEKSAGLFGRKLRTEAMELLLNSPDVDTDFIIRDRFWAGETIPDRINSSERQSLIRQEYLQNIINTDYTLCIRGAGNFSIRIYETLSCGRIPLFVDTDSVLPYDFAVDWKQYCVWVEQHEQPYIAEKLADFHASLSPQQFIDLQYACREFWNDWLSPHGFFANFYRHYEAVN